MAILKAINVKNAGRKKFLETLDYVANPDKNPQSNTAKRAKEFKINSFVNRVLHGKMESKRHFKQFVVSMAVQWSSTQIAREGYMEMLENVLHSCEMYFIDKGFWARGWIHCNTIHPHFHILLETCNAIDGKQYSQSQSDLAAFKNYLNEQLVANGLEKIIMINEVSEEELLSDEEPIVDEYDSDEHKNSYGISDWNFGTVEHDEVFISRENSNFRTMCIVAQPLQKREMCRIVNKEQTSDKREMCRIITNK